MGFLKLMARYMQRIRGTSHVTGIIVGMSTRRSLRGLVGMLDSGEQ